MNNWFNRGRARQEFNALIGTIKTWRENKCKS